MFWLPDEKSLPIGKDPDAGKDWRQKEKGEAEDEVVRITDSMDMNVSKLREIVKDRSLQSMGSQKVRHDLANDQKQQHKNIDIHRNRDVCGYRIDWDL